MKKILVILGALMIFSSNCFAMTFSQPEKIGTVGYSAAPNGGVEIVGATNIQNYSSVKNSHYYGKGVARFGNSLYFYFNDEYFRKNFNGYTTELTEKVSRFGGTDVKNSVPIFTLEGETNIYQIKNDGGIELYLAQTETGGGGSIQVFGTTKEGKWVKYFDTQDAIKNFGIPRSDYIENFFTFDDEIIFQYAPGRWEQDGELRYKWDEKAKWFGVENKTSEYFRKYLMTDSNPSNRFSMSTGSGLALIIDKNNIKTQKINNGCIISFRAFYIDANKKPHFVTFDTPSRYMYDFSTKKIYDDKSPLKQPAKWEYVNPNTQPSSFKMAKAVYSLAYGRNFF